LRFQVKTNYTYKGIKQFQRIALKKMLKARMQGVRIFYAVVGAFSLVCGFILLWLNEYLALMIVAFALSAFFLLPAIFFQSFMAWSAMRRIHKSVKEVVYTFGEERLMIDNAVEKKSYEYSAIYALFESKDHFFIFLTIQTGYTLSKSAFTIGAPGELKEFLVEKTKKPMEYIAL